jgi:hypothetical protein
MSQPTSNSTPHRRHAPVKEKSTPQMRAVRKEVLLLRADVERAEFMKARVELQHEFKSFGWLKMLVPGLRGKRRKGGGRNLNEILSDWIGLHPLASSLVSMFLARILRRVRPSVAAGAKPLLKWGGLGLVAWTGYRLWKQITSENRKEAPGEGGPA